MKTTFDFSLMHLKRRSVVWAEKATLHVQNRTDLRKLAWKHVSWETAEDFARLLAQAQVATPSTNKPSSTWTKRKSQRKRKTRTRRKVLQRPPVPASLLPRVQPSSTDARWTSSWFCASSMAKGSRVHRSSLDAGDPISKPSQNHSCVICHHVFVFVGVTSRYWFSHFQARIWCGMGTTTKSAAESCLTLGGALPLRTSADASYSGPSAANILHADTTPSARRLSTSSKTAGGNWRTTAF